MPIMYKQLYLYEADLGKTLVPPPFTPVLANWHFGTSLLSKTAPKPHLLHATDKTGHKARTFYIPFSAPFANPDTFCITGITWLASNGQCVRQLLVHG